MDIMRLFIFVFRVNLRTHSDTFTPVTWYSMRGTNAIHVSRIDSS